MQYLDIFVAYYCINDTDYGYKNKQRFKPETIVNQCGKVPAHRKKHFATNCLPTGKPQKCKRILFFAWAVLCQLGLPNPHHTISAQP